LNAVTRYQDIDRTYHGIQYDNDDGPARIWSNSSRERLNKEIDFFGLSKLGHLRG
jgi:hypothetical protein